MKKNEFTPDQWLELFHNKSSEQNLFVDKNHDNPFENQCNAYFKASDYSYIYVSRPLQHLNKQFLSSLFNHFSSLPYDCTLLVPCLINKQYHLFAATIRNRKQAFFYINIFNKTPKKITQFIKKQKLFDNPILINLNKTESKKENFSGLQNYIIARKFIDANENFTESSLSYFDRDIEKLKDEVFGIDQNVPYTRYSTIRYHKPVIIAGFVACALIGGLVTALLWPILFPTMLATYTIVIAVISALVLGGLTGFLIFTMSCKIYDTYTKHKNMQKPVILDVSPELSFAQENTQTTKKLNTSLLEPAYLTMMGMINQYFDHHEKIHDLNHKLLIELLSEKLKLLTAHTFKVIFKDALEGKDPLLNKDFLNAQVHNLQAKHLYRVFEVEPALPKKIMRRCQSQESLRCEPELKNTIPQTFVY